MTIPAHQSATSEPLASIPADAGVLPAQVTAGNVNPAPLFADGVWCMKPFVPRTTKLHTIDFSTLPGDEITALTVREYFYSRLNRGTIPDAPGRLAGAPMKPTWVYSEFCRVRRVLNELASMDVRRLSMVTHQHLDQLLATWKAQSVMVATQHVTVVKHLAAHGKFLSRDRLLVIPWPGRSAKAVAGYRRSTENSTERIPEHISAPLLRAAVFYVDTAGGDILAARQEIAGLEAAAAYPLIRCQARAKIHAFIHARRRAGRGIPAIPAHLARGVDAHGVDNDMGLVVNVRVCRLLAGIGGASAHRHVLTEAAAELGYELGGMDTPISPWPATGRAWRPGFNPHYVRIETEHLRTACWIVIAFLSGMRDAEVRELGCDCAFTEPGADGRTRYKLRGRVFKDRKLTGDDAEWVVLDVVHRAVEMLRCVNDDPTHLFGYDRGQPGGPTLTSQIPQRLAKFRDHVNDLFGTPEQLFIPDDGDLPWVLNTMQFRRTLAWHIARQPFGVVAGARQFKHAKIAVFEGYAGTSDSGFAAEVAAEEAVAKLDYLEDLYRDWNDGGAASGGAVHRINAEFDRIRAELGDLPGVIARPSRLRAMLQHLTRILHPGSLNDCFFDASTAVCAKRAKQLGRPVPMLDACNTCPNSRRTSLHLPRLITARNQAQAAFPQHPNQLRPLQAQALTQHLTTLDTLIASLDRHQETAP